YRRELEASRYQLAAVLVRRGERDREAEATYRQVLAVQQKRADQFRDRPEWPEQAREVARTRNNLGILLEVADRQGAEEQFHEAVRLLEQLTARFPSVAAYQWLLARSSNNLGNVRRKASALPEAEQAYQEAERRLVT